MLLIVLCLILGILIGFILPFELPVIAAKYVSIAFLAGLDSVLGGTRAGLERHFEFKVFLSGFAVNLLLAALLTWVGDKLGVDIYLAAVVTFGVRIFNNLGYIRRDLLKKPADASSAHRATAAVEVAVTSNPESSQSSLDELASTLRGLPQPGDSLNVEMPESGRSDLLRR